jgi:hypothetical protein
MLFLIMIWVCNLYANLDACSLQRIYIITYLSNLDETLGVL